jgi:hypothetical protein
MDGCYHADDMYRFDDEPNFASLAWALRAGNPDRIIAFNPGAILPVISVTEHEDYTAGELTQALHLGRWTSEGYRPLAGSVDGAQCHLLTFLGEFWGVGEPRFTDDLVRGYTRHVNGCGAVVTWDVPVSAGGRIPQVFVDQLRSIDGR